MFTYVYYCAKNLQGDIVGLYKRNPDGTGTQVIATYDYDPWGKMTAVRDANGNLVTYPSASNLIAFMNPLRYRGYYQDNDTGFYYLQSRYYDPELKRFINSDTHLLSGDKFVSFNLFAYCENDPQSRIDTGGNTSTSIPYQDIKIWLSDEDLALLIAELMEALGSYGWILFAFWFDEAPAVPKGSYELQKPLDITESKGKAAAKKIAKPNTAAGEVSSPPSPNGKGNRNKKGKKNQQPHNLSTQYRGDNTYNKNAIRVDYEYYGNGEGNVHIHVNGGKFRYDPMTNSLIPYKDAVLTAAVRKLLSNPEIMAAIRRGLQYIAGS